jgi:hypothetical protein
VKTYEEGIALLVERLKAMHRSEWSPTPKRKAAEAIAARLDELADLLAEDGIAQPSIQQFHDQPPQPQPGIDGWPEPVVKWVEGFPEPTMNHRDSYSGTIGHMRALAESARQVAADLPNPRTKPALPFAALALLHLRYEHGYPRPTMYEAGDDVHELQRVTEVAGIVLSPQRLRGALTEAWSRFDPAFVPDYIDELIR